MGYSTYESQWNTLQTGYDFFNPKFQVTSRVNVSIGYSDWLISELGSLPDNMFRPGEQIILYDYSLFYGTFKTPGKLVIYEGLVDLDGDTFFDGVLVSQFGLEYILTEKSPYIDFNPYSTQVLLYKVNLNTEFLFAPTQPTEPKYNLISGTTRGDRLNGTSLDDAIFGRKGADVINGKKGNDLLDGGSGNDTIVGGAGADSIWGGKGRDKLKGGGGPDDFWFDTKNKFDIVLDFRGNDTIVVDTSVRAFRGVNLDDIRIKNGDQFDKVWVDDDLIVKVYGADVGLNDIFII